MFRSRILRQRTFMQGRIPKFYTHLKNPLPRTAGNVDSGRMLYIKHCETCHGTKGLGSGESEKGLAPSPALLAFMIKLPESVDPYLMWTIAEGGKPFGTDMPAFKNVLTADQIWQIITYMRSGFRGWRISRGVAVGRLVSVNPSASAAVFASSGCKQRRLRSAVW